MLLSVDNLSVSRGGISLFEGLNFTVSTGEFVLINGGNGVGKTSLLRSIAGLQPIDKGKIAINADNFIFAGDRAEHQLKENLEKSGTNSAEGEGAEPGCSIRSQINFGNILDTTASRTTSLIKGKRALCTY